MTPRPRPIVALLLLACVAAARAQTVSLDSVVVTSTRHATVCPQSTSTLMRSDLEAMERPSALPTLSDMVPGLFATARGVAGYGVSDGAAGQITIRGLSSGNGQVLTLVDGHPQYQGLFGHSATDGLLALLCDRVEVTRGPASATLGTGAMGGAVNLVTRRMDTDGQRTDLSLGAGSYGTVQAQAANQVRHGKLSTALAAQFIRTDNHRPSMDFRQLGGLAKLAYEASPHWNTSAHLSLTNHAASYPGSTQSPLIDARQWVTRGEAQATVENHYPRTQGTLSAYHSFGRHKINDGHAPEDEPKDYLFHSHDALSGLSVQQTTTPARGTSLTASIDWQRIHGRAWNQNMQTQERTPTTGNTGHETENSLAAHLAASQDIGHLVSLSAALRLDHHSQAGTEWVPQGAVTLRPAPDATLTASASKGFRQPSLRELYLWGAANPDLRPERTANAELAWRHSPQQAHLSYSATIFLIKGSNIIQTTTDPATGRPRNENTGHISNAGIELEADWQPNTHWRVQSNYSYLHQTRPTVSTPTHKAHLGASYATGLLTLRAGLTLVGRLYTQTPPDDTHTESFQLLSASATLRLGKVLALWLTGENLLAQRYETLLGYPMPRATAMAGLRLTL